uniref:DUF3718 domain-containing protein n=1 Tax=Ningiella ruwaisensis TaxID=2364274 RepID=UPI00109EEED8|nr:DUF3718 domain-containing protein [Ningiella ruwaisensis]
MTLLKTIAVLTLGSIAGSALSNEVVLKPVDQKLETQICYVAATEGVPAARTLMRANDINTSVYSTSIKCNGQSIADFAQRYAPKITAQENPVAKAQTVKLVAVEGGESQLCIDAVVMGVNRAKAKHHAENRMVYCNDMALEDFVREFEGRVVSL